MSNRVNYLKYKFASDDFNEKLGNIIYQYTFNPDIKPVAIDKLKVFGYGIVLKSNVGVCIDPLCERFEKETHSEQILVLQNEDTEEMFAILLPPIFGSTYVSYLFDTDDLCFPSIEETDIVKDGYLITNNSGIQYVIEIYELDDNKEYMLDELMPEHFLDFSKACCIIRKKGKHPSFDEVVELYDKM